MPSAVWRPGCASPEWRWSGPHCCWTRSGKPRPPPVPGRSRPSSAPACWSSVPSGKHTCMSMPKHTCLCVLEMLTTNNVYRLKCERQIKIKAAFDSLIWGLAWKQIRLKVIVLIPNLYHIISKHTGITHQNPNRYGQKWRIWVKDHDGIWHKNLGENDYGVPLNGTKKW